ncbi:hypothetical protein ACFL1H_03810 [Nanoarchaeota archaeon]
MARTLLIEKFEKLPQPEFFPVLNIGGKEWEIPIISGDQKLELSDICEKEIISHLKAETLPISTSPVRSFITGLPYIQAVMLNRGLEHNASFLQYYFLADNPAIDKDLGFFCTKLGRNSRHIRELMDDDTFLNEGAEVPFYTYLRHDFLSEQEKRYVNQWFGNILASMEFRKFGEEKNSALFHELLNQQDRPVQNYLGSLELHPQTQFFYITHFIQQQHNGNKPSTKELLYEIAERLQSVKLDAYDVGFNLHRTKAGIYFFDEALHRAYLKVGEWGSGTPQYWKANVYSGLGDALFEVYSILKNRKSAETLAHNMRNNLRTIKKRASGRIDRRSKGIINDRIEHWKILKGHYDILFWGMPSRTELRKYDLN